MQQLKLNRFLEKHSNLPKQGSQEWLDQRKNTVGGSQIASIMGINKYENVKQFILSKTDKYVFKKAPPLWFGTLMEPCVEQYVEMVYGIKTEETGSLPCEFNSRLSYSPDGLGIVPKSKLRDLAEQGILHSFSEDIPEEPIVLFEFKSPYMRVITQGHVPEYYIPQPLLGMELIDIADLSIFIECVFRFCSIKDLRNEKYSSYHFDRKRLSGYEYFGGMSLFWIGEPSIHVATTDLSGITDKNMINSIMETAVDSKNVRIEYKPMFKKVDEDIDVFNEYLYKHYVELDKTKDGYLGTFTYKLYEANNVFIKKEKLITEELSMQIDTVFERIKEVSQKIKEMNDTAFKKYWRQYDCFSYSQ